MASYSARILALYFAENCRRPGDRSGTSGSGGVVPVIAPESWRAATLRSIVVVMGEVPSPPSQLIDSSTRTVSLEVDTEGGKREMNGVVWSPAPSRLSLSDREEISLGLRGGETLRAIAQRMGRATSTKIG